MIPDRLVELTVELDDRLGFDGGPLWNALADLVVATVARHGRLTYVNVPGKTECACSEGEGVAWADCPEIRALALLADVLLGPETP